MRTYVLIFATLAVLGGAFFVYSREQTAGSTSGGRQIHVPEPTPATRPTTDSTSALQIVGRPWVTMISHGRVSSRYRAQDAIPRPDGTVHLISPEADFYVGLHERLHITGVDGDVVMHTSTGAVSLTGKSQPTGQPTRGRLNDVKMQLLDETVVDNPLVELTMTANNIEFDNDSFLVTTGGYTSPDGKNVPPDQVPVKVRGEYEFDGRGLTMRWNDQDDRLERLEIAHGEKLTIVHPSSRNGVLGGSTTQPVSTTSPAAAPVAGATATRSAPASTAQPAGLAASSTPRGGTSAIAAGNSTPAGVAKPVTKPPRKAKPIYLATFERDVRITQENDLLMTGDEMHLHFRMKDQPEATSAQPSNAAPPHADISAAQPFAGAMAAGGKGICVSASATPGAPGSATTDSQATGSVLSDRPIVVTWTGRLLIVPDPADPPLAMRPGDSVLELIGTSNLVNVFRGATEDSPASRIKCSRLTYATSNGDARFEGSPTEITREPIGGSLQDDPALKTIVTTDVLDFRSSEHFADLQGRGHAIIPMAPNGNEKQPVLDARWSKNAHFDFFPRHGNDMVIQNANFTGDVKINHPQLKLDAQNLSLAFNPLQGDAKAPPGSAPPLSEVKASDPKGLVNCQMTDSAGKPQDVKCHVLDLHTGRTADGRVLAQRIDAIGNVDATDATHEMTCDRVQMTLRPAAAKKATASPDAGAPVDTSSVELDRMDARGNVIVVNKSDRSSTQSDQLLVAMDPGGPNVMMTGDKQSKVIDAKNNVLTGANLVIRPNQQIANVIGPGTIHCPGDTGKGTAGGTTSRKMDVIFSDGADMDGKANKIKLRGHPVVRMPDSDGTINTAQADVIDIDLEEKPKPATRPAVAKGPPATKPAEDPNGLGNKQAKLITLDGNAVVVSTLSDATGILRQRELKAPLIFYSLTGAGDIPPRTLLVPTPGQMLVRDHRPPTTATAAGGGGDDAGMGGGRGVTAFKWTKRLIYSEDAHKAVMSGDVLVAHEADDPKELPVQVTADEMTAIFTPAGVKLVGAPASNGGAMELHSLEADGNVAVTRGNEQLTAPKLYYEPLSHWMTATGNAQTPATMIDAQGTRSTADEIRWNTETWAFSMKRATGGGRR
jgi:hypothetical protein